MLNYQDIIALNEAIDSTFGRSSIRDAGHGIHCAIKAGSAEGEHILEIRYETIITMHPYHVETTQREYDDVSIKALNEEIKKIKADFKEISGKTLTATKGTNKSYLDIISHNPSVLRGKYYNTIQYNIK